MKPAADGAADAATLMMLSVYPGVAGGNMGEARFCFPNMGDASGFPYVDAVGEIGAGSWWMGFGPLGNSH